MESRCHSCRRQALLEHRRQAGLDDDTISNPNDDPPTIRTCGFPRTNNEWDDHFRAMEDAQ